MLNELKRQLHKMLRPEPVGKQGALRTILEDQGWQPNLEKFPLLPPFVATEK